MRRSNNKKISCLSKFNPAIFILLIPNNSSSLPKDRLIKITNELMMVDFAKSLKISFDITKTIPPKSNEKIIGNTIDPSAYSFKL